jgi:hypothetical protein
MELMSEISTFVMFVHDCTRVCERIRAFEIRTYSNRLAATSHTMLPLAQRTRSSYDNLLSYARPSTWIIIEESDAYRI